MIASAQTLLKVERQKLLKMSTALELGNLVDLVAQAQGDQIGRFLHFGQLFKACDITYFAQISHILGNFCRGVKILRGISFGQLLWTFGDFLLVTLFKQHMA